MIRSSIEIEPNAQIVAKRSFRKWNLRYGGYSNGTNSVGKCGSTRTGALVAVLNSRSLPALWT